MIKEKTNKTNNLAVKKIALFILILMFIQIFLPITAFAFDNPIPNPVDLVFNWGKSFVKSTLQELLAGLGYVVLRLMSWLVYVASGIFDLAAEFTLDYNTYSRGAAKAVYMGWQAVRDFVNLFFIFGILIIAVSLILQISAYYSKQVLTRFVVVALFINFSFFICQQIINFTNSAALYFKNAAVVNVGKQESNSWALSKLFVDKLNPQQLLGGYKTGKMDITNSMGLEEKKEVEKINNALGKLKEKDVGFMAIIISTVGGSILMLLASLILFAAAMMFILRAVILWNLIILSPIAFMASIFPATQSWFRSWWNRFIREAFFAPLFLFLFYIDMMILNDDFLTKFVAKNNTATIGQTIFFNYYLVMNYVVMITLFAKSLMLAQNLRATGADTFMRWGEKLKDKSYDIARGPGRQLRTTGAVIGTGVLEGEGRVARAARWVPGLKAGARELVKRERARVDELQKNWGAYSSKDLANEANKPLIAASKLVAITKELKKRDDLDMIKPSRLKDAHYRMSNIGEQTKEIETFMPSLAKSGQPREKAVQRQQADKAADYAKNTEEFRDAETLGYVRKYWGGDHLTNGFKAAKTNSDTMNSMALLMQEYIKEYGADLGGGKIDTDKIVKGLENDNNFKAAKFVDSKEGVKTLEEFLGTLKAKGSPLKDASGTEYKELTQPKGAIREKAKEASELKNVELERQIKAASATGAKEEEKQNMAEVVKNMDIKRLTQIMDDLSHTERKELALMLKNNKDEAKKIINIDPTIVDKLTSAEKTQFAAAGLNLTTTKEYVNRMGSGETRNLSHGALMDEEVIKSLNRIQLEDIAEDGDLTNEELERMTNVLKISGSAMTQELKDYLSGSPYWRIMIP